MSRSSRACPSPTSRRCCPHPDRPPSPISGRTRGGSSPTGAPRTARGGAQGRCRSRRRIAEGLAASGRIGRAAMRRGLEAGEMFARYADALGVARQDVTVVATSAIRDASNHSDLIDGLTRRTGWTIRISPPSTSAPRLPRGDQLHHPHGRPDARSRRWKPADRERQGPRADRVALVAAGRRPRVRAAAGVRRAGTSQAAHTRATTLRRQLGSWTRCRSRAPWRWAAPCGTSRRPRSGPQDGPCPASRATSCAERSSRSSSRDW